MKDHSQFSLDRVNKIPENRASDFVSVGSITRTDKTLNVKDFHSLGDIEFRTIKGQKFGRTPFSTTGLGVAGAVYSAAATDYLIAVTSLAYAPTIGLPKPSLAGVGKNYIVKDETGGAGTTTITIQSAGEENIDGASTSTITTNYGSKEFYTNGAVWFTK